jgi:hypothetical protein
VAAGEEGEFGSAGGGVGFRRKGFVRLYTGSGDWLCFTGRWATFSLGNK